MKKLISVILAAMLALAVLAGCSSERPESREDVDVTSFKTIGRIWESGKLGEIYSSATYEDRHVFAFEMDGKLYRVTAPISKETFDAVMAIDYMDEDWQEKEDRLIYPLAIEKWEDLSERIPSQDELGTLIGKTGEDLVNDGWTITGYDLSENRFWMEKGAFRYIVMFDGDAGNFEGFDVEEDMGRLTVKSVEFNGLGQGATDPEEAMG